MEKAHTPSPTARNLGGRREGGKSIAGLKIPVYKRPGNRQSEGQPEPDEKMKYWLSLLTTLFPDLLMKYIFFYLYFSSDSE